MDQDASNKQGGEQLHPVPQDPRAEQPLAEVAIMDNTIVTPEAEMDIDLPHFQGTEELESTPRKKIRTEVPDSEEASEVSSPVKNDRDEEQGRDEAVELEKLQMDQEAPEQDFDQEDTSKAERKMARAENSDSEEAFEFSGPIKVGMGTTGGPEASGERELQVIENGGITVMDFSAPGPTEGILDGSRSEIEQDHELDRTGKSGNDTMELMDTMKEMEYTAEKGESSKSVTEHEGTEQQNLSMDNDDGPSADTSPTTAQTKELNSDTSHAEANGGASLHEAPQNRGNASPMETFAQMPLSSPTTVAEGIAAVVQRRLGEWS